MRIFLNGLRTDICMLALLASLMFSFEARADNEMREPLTVIESLANEIYVAAEVTGEAAQMIAAEEKAAKEIRSYVASGATEGLLAKTKGGQSPLTAAAYQGYPNVVAALLESELVKVRINDADDLGVTPWIAASLAMKQSIWACNPMIFDDPFQFTAAIVVLPYYVLNPMPPYARVRELLEQAGASPDMEKAKVIWLEYYKFQTAGGKARVRASSDMQKTVQILGSVALGQHFAETELRKLENKD